MVETFAYKYLTSFTVAFFFFALWIFSSVKGQKNDLAQAFNLLLLNQALWPLVNAMLFWTASLNEALFWAKWVYCLGALIPTFFLFVSFSYETGSYTISRLKRYLVLVPNLIIIYLFFFTPYMLESIVLVNGDKGYDYGPLHLLWDVQFNGYFCWVFYRFFDLYRHSTGVARYHLKFINLGLLISFILAGMTNVMMPSVLHRFELIWLGPPFTMPFMIAVTYAILKYQLLDIQVFIKKSLVYTALITFITVIYFIFIFITEKFFKDIFGYQSFLASVLAAVAIALVFIPLKNIIQAFIDKYFFKGTYIQIAQENELLRREAAQIERYKTLASLTGNIVSEIKSPLATIMGYGYHLPQRHTDAEFIKKFSTIIKMEGERINDLLKHLTDYSSPAPLTSTTVDIKKLLYDTTGMVKSELNEKGIELTQEFRMEGLLELVVDPNQLRQALFNIIMNAVEAMPKGGKLRIYSERTNEHFKIDIEDNGEGIAAEDLPKIFDPFFSRKKGRAGLGLSIAQGIVENHKGKLQVTSKPYSGTKVTILLPVRGPV